MDDKKRRFTAIILGLMIFLSNGDNYASATLISNIAHDLGLTISAASISITVYMLGYGLFTLVFGPLGDKYGKVRIVLIASIGTAIFSILGSIAFNLTSLVTFRLINGMFGSGTFPVNIALVGEMYGDKERYKAIAGVMSMGLLGSATATIIGGSIAYFASWRMVYLVYGIGELILALIMVKTLERDKGVRAHLEFGKSYGVALSNFKFMRLAVLLFLMGFAVFGTFTYMGISFMDKTGLSILVVGFLLAGYGVGTVFGGRIVAKVKMKLGRGFLLFAGFIGASALIFIEVTSSVLLLVLGLFILGIAFVFIQSTIISTLQAMLPTMKGTVMSIASFNLFVGAAVGTSINAKILKVSSMNRVYVTAALLLFIIGVLSSVYLNHYEYAEKQKAKEKLYA